MSATVSKLSSFYTPIGCPKSNGRDLDKKDVRVWVKEKKPNIFQRTSYGTYGGIGALILGAVIGFFGIKNDSGFAKTSGATISLAGLVTGLFGESIGIDENADINKPAERQAENHNGESEVSSSSVGYINGGQDSDLTASVSPSTEAVQTSSIESLLSGSLDEMKAAIPALVDIVSNNVEEKQVRGLAANILKKIVMQSSPKDRGDDFYKYPKTLLSTTLGKPAAVKLLMYELENNIGTSVNDWTPLVYVTSALGSFKAKESLPLLISSFKEDCKGSEHESPLATAIESISPASFIELLTDDKISADKKRLAIYPLTQRTKDFSKFADAIIQACSLHDDQSLIDVSCSALGKMKSKALPALMKSIDNERVKKVVLGFLSELQLDLGLEEASKLIPILRSGNEVEQNQASKSLVGISPEGVPLLVNEFTTGDDKLKERVTSILKELGEKAESTVTVLISALTHKNKIIRENAAIALTNIGLPAMPKLIESYNNGGVKLKFIISSIFSNMEGETAKDAVPSLMTSLTSTNKGVKQSAEKALMNMSGKVLIPEFLQYLKVES